MHDCVGGGRPHCAADSSHGVSNIPAVRSRGQMRLAIMSSCSPELRLRFGQFLAHTVDVVLDIAAVCRASNILRTARARVSTVNGFEIISTSLSRTPLCTIAFLA